MASEGGSRLVPQMQANFLVQGGGSCNNFYGYLVPEPGGCGDKKLICHQWECEVGSTGSILFRGCNEARSAQGICQVTGITERADDARRIVHIRIVEARGPGQQVALTRFAPDQTLCNF